MSNITTERRASAYAGACGFCNRYLPTPRGDTPSHDVIELRSAKGGAVFRACDDCAREIAAKLSEAATP